MSQPAYVPERGDFAWIDLNPRHGHEQAGHRPVLVLSPKAYNRKTGLCIVCPATRQVKGYAFEVEYSEKEGASGVVLSDHVRCIDWRARRARFIQRVPQRVLEEVVAKLDALIIEPKR